MGWFDTIIGLTSVAVDVATLSQVQKMSQALGDSKLQAALGAAWDAFIHDMKNEIFKFRQAAKEVLRNEDQQPLIAAGAMKLLEINLDESPVKAEIFPDLADKEYFDETARLIGENSRRMMRALSPAEREAVNEMLAASAELARLNYYIDNYEDGCRLREAEDTVARLGGRNSSSARLGLGCGIGLIVLVLFLAISAAADASVGFVFVLLVGVPAFIGLYLWQSRKKYDQALLVVKQLDDRIDQELFARIDAEMQGSLPIAKKQAAGRQRIVDRFFAGQAMEKPAGLAANAIPAGAIGAAAAVQDAANGETAGTGRAGDSRAKEKTGQSKEQAEKPLAGPVSGSATAAGGAASNPIPAATAAARSPRDRIKFCARCGAEVTDPEANTCAVCGEELLG